MDEYPVDVVAEYPERSSRLLALAGLLTVFKILLILPHILVLTVLGFVAYFATLVGWIGILIVGYYPRGLYDFQVGILRWNLRVNAYFLSVTDRYPPFRLYD